MSDVEFADLPELRGIESDEDIPVGDHDPAGPVSHELGDGVAVPIADGTSIKVLKPQTFVRLLWDEPRKGQRQQVLVNDLTMEMKILPRIDEVF